jgi:hypothetical protein
VNTESTNGTGQDEKPLSQPESLDDALVQITKQPKRQYSQQEIDEAREELALMDNRVFMATFMDNKNNHIITWIVNALRKIHSLPPIAAIEFTIVQSMSLLDALGRGMVGDLIGWGKMISLAIEVQKRKHDDYAVRGTITAGNATRIGFKPGDDYTEAPDAITINILDFRLPELENRKMFFSRIVRAEYESKEPFLAEKYSEYYIELPKMDGFTKAELPEEYHDLWDLCCIFRAKIKQHEEVIRMQAIDNPMVLELSNEVRKAVAPDQFVREALSREDELAQLREYVIRQKQRAKEDMIITALRCNAPSELIENMREGAGITEARLAELREQAQAS